VRQVELIKIDSDKATIYEGQDFMQISHCDLPAMIENSDMEFLYHSRIDVENIPIKRIVENNIDYYVAVSKNVWEWLYFIDNPVTAKSQKEKIKELKKDGDYWHGEACRMGDAFDKIKKYAFKASLWQRVKWVFIGFKL